MLKHNLCSRRCGPLPNHHCGRDSGSSGPTAKQLFKEIATGAYRFTQTQCSPSPSLLLDHSLRKNDEEAEYFTSKYGPNFLGPIALVTKVWSSLPRSPFPSCLRLLWSPFKSFHPFLPLQAVTAVAAAGNILTVFHQNPSTDQDPSINSEPLFFTMMLFLTMRRSTEPILWRKPSVLLTTYTVPILILHCTKSRKQRSLLPFMLFLLALCLSIWVIWSLPMTMVLHVLHPRFTVSYISPGVIILHQSIYEILNGALLHLFCTKIKFTHHNKTF